ncbi:hypothetical protein GQ600_21074 [Phytophthora cactorum]|nr:hypothetical protein GQ600_21074 [Phytophthora cactorum]
MYWIPKTSASSAMLPRRQAPIVDH